MAEIKVEKKNRPVWPWIIGIVLLAAIIWIVADDNDMESEAVSNVNVEEQADRYTADENGAAMEYVQYIENNGKEITLEHKYSHQALTHLSKALDAVAKNPSQETQQRLDELRSIADQLKKNTYSDEHADMMAKAFKSAAMAMQSVQNDQYPNLGNEVQQVRNAADNITGEELATNQKNAIRSFFQESADAVEAMANA